MKLPRLPHKGNIFEAKYSAEQMREYGRKCIEHHILMNTPQILRAGRITRIDPPVQKSIIDKIKEAW